MKRQGRIRGYLRRIRGEGAPLSPDEEQDLREAQKAMTRASAPPQRRAEKR